MPTSWTQTKNRAYIPMKKGNTERGTRRKKRELRSVLTFHYTPLPQHPVSFDYLNSPIFNFNSYIIRKLFFLSTRFMRRLHGPRSLSMFYKQCRVR